MSIEPFFELVNGLVLMLGAVFFLALLFTVFMPVAGYIIGFLIGQYFEWSSSASQGLGVVSGILLLPLWLKLNKSTNKKTEEK